VGNARGHCKAAHQTMVAGLCDQRRPTERSNALAATPL
jgi:hypothetical protein